MSVLILGTFDGVHTAHRQLIHVGRQSGESIIACTFSSPFSRQKQMVKRGEICKGGIHQMLCVLCRDLVLLVL